MYTALLLGSLIALSSSQTPPPKDLDPASKVYGLSLFWKEASDHFVFFDKLPHLDWDKAYREYVPKVLATTSTDAYYDVLKEFAALLQDSHTKVHAPARQTPAVSTVAAPPIAVSWNTDEKHLFVFNVAKSLAEQVPLGSEIVAVEDKPLLEYVQEKWGKEAESRPAAKRMALMLDQALWGPPGSDVRFTIVTPTGVKKEVVTPRKYEKGMQWVWDAWPQRPRVEHRDLGDGIAYVALNSFGDMKTAEEFEKLMPTLEKAKGLVIDLRNNYGGSDLVGARIVQNFTTGPFRSFASRTREVKSAFKAWGVYVNPASPNLSEEEKTYLKHSQGKAWFEMPPEVYKGKPDAKLLMPKVVLVGRTTLSAAEDTLIMLGDIPNVTSVGQRTYGGTGQPLFFSLPGGGTGAVCAQHCYLPDGGEFMDIGIKPEVEVPAPTVRERIAKKDSTLEKGLEVLKASLRQR